MIFNTSLANEMLKKNLVRNLTLDPIINEIVSYKPVDDHHFNLQAPQNCGLNGTIDKSTRVINCQYHTAGKHNIVLSVCDNANTYCKNERLTVTVQNQLSKNPKIKVPPSEDTIKMQNEVKIKLQSEFLVMSPEKAKASLEDKKAALVMISAEWCPPCNLAKEFLISTKKFQDQTKDLLLIYVDGDSPTSTQWAPILKSYFYPTFIVLNKNLENVAMFTDTESNVFFDNLSKGISMLGDPNTKLEVRIKNRLEGRYFQKFLDLFASGDSVELDQERYIKLLEVRSEIQEQIDFMKAISKEKYKDQIVMAELKLFMFGRQDLELSPEDSKKRQDALVLEALNLSPDKDEFYFSNLKDFCEATKDQSSKKVSSKCKEHVQNYVAYLEKKRSEPLKNIFESEKFLNKADYYLELAKVNQILGESKLASDNFKLCFNELEKLYVYSPLKEKSRSIRFQQMYCLKDVESSQKSLAVLESLSKDYPFEETFQRKLSAYFLEKKDFVKALEYNEKALKYSYGIMWAYNMSTKASILEAMKKKSEALEVINQALKEIVMDKGSKITRVVTMLRDQKQSLEVN